MLFTKLRQLKQEAHKIHLSNDEKSVMNKNILEFMNSHPLPSEPEPTSRLTHMFSAFTVFNRKHMFATMAAVLVVLLTGSVSYAAEGSFPGQPLYPIKQINEEVKAAISVTAEADAQWNTRRVERRLEEAATLAATGKLDAEKETQIQKSIESQLKTATIKIKKLESKGKVEAAADLSTRLNNDLIVHEQILSSFEEKKNVNHPSQDDYDKKLHDNTVGHVQNPKHQNNLVDEIKLQASEIRKVNVELNTKILDAKIKTDTTPNGEEKAAHAKITATEHKIQEVQQFIEKKSPEVSTQVKAQATTRLLGAQQLLIQAKAKENAKLFREAFDIASHAQTIAQEAKVVIATQANIKVDLHLDKVIDDDLFEPKEKPKLEVKNATTSTRKDARILNTELKAEVKKNLPVQVKKIEIPALPPLKLKVKEIENALKKESIFRHTTSTLEKKIQRIKISPHKKPSIID